MENLQNHDIRSISITSILRLDEEQRLYDVFMRHQDGWPETAIDKLGFYEVEGVRHHLGLDIAKLDGPDTDSVLFELEAHVFSQEERIEQSTRLRQEKEYEEVQAILVDLKDSKTRGLAHFHVEWRFPPDSRVPIIQLPMMTLHSPTAPFSEISGVRIKKRTDEGTMDVIMDLLEDKFLVVRIGLPLRLTEIADTLLSHTIQAVSQVLDEFVFEEDLEYEGQEGAA